MRLLITGGSGLLGGRLAVRASGDHQVIATYNSHPQEAPHPGVRALPMDITERAQVFSTIKELLPQVIVHSAAWVDADGCQVDRRRAYRINVEGTRNVVQAGTEVGARIVYISSDYVFDGTKGWYKEEDTPTPISYYGETKAEGERIVQELCDDFIIARLTVMFGLNPVRRDFVRWVIESLRQGQPIRVVTDQRGSPTYADAAADALVKLIEAGARGIFHVSGRECIDRYSLAVKVAEIFSLDKGLIAPVLSRDLKQKAPRPKFGCLDVSKVEAFLGERMPTLEEALLRYKAQLEGIVGTPFL